MMDKYKDSIFGIKGLTAREYNRRCDELAREGIPNFCPGCNQPNLDNLLVKIDSFGHKHILSGGCKRCSDSQSKGLRNFYTCKDLLTTPSEKGEAE